MATKAPKPSPDAGEAAPLVQDEQSSPAADVAPEADTSADVDEPAPDAEASPDAGEAAPEAQAAPADAIPMHHPDGGASDAFPLDDAGNSLVPFDAIETMQAHGFVTAVASEEAE